MEPNSPEYKRRQKEWELWSLLTRPDEPSRSNPNDWRWRTMSAAEAKTSRPVIVRLASELGLQIAEHQTVMQTGTVTTEVIC